MQRLCVFFSAEALADCVAPLASDVSISRADVGSSAIAAGIAGADAAGADIVVDTVSDAETSFMRRSSRLSSTSSSLQTTLHQPIMLEGNNTH